MSQFFPTAVCDFCNWKTCHRIVLWVKAWPEAGRKGFHKGLLFDFGCTFRFSLSLNLLFVAWEMILLALVGFCKNMYLENHGKCKWWGHSLARGTDEHWNSQQGWKCFLLCAMLLICRLTAHQVWAGYPLFTNLSRCVARCEITSRCDGMGCTKLQLC